MIFYVNDEVNLAFLHDVVGGGRKLSHRIRSNDVVMMKSLSVGHQKLAKQFVLFTFRLEKGKSKQKKYFERLSRIERF